MLVDTRSLARQQLAYVGPSDRDGARRSALRCIAFAHLLRDHVRGDHPGPEALAVLDARTPWRWPESATRPTSC